MDTDLKKLTGFYRGKVLKHLNHGYCKIFIYGIYDEEYLKNPDLLPPAEQATAMFGGCNKGSGVFTYPNIDSIVWCFFENGEQNKPVYFATTLGGEKPKENYDFIRPMPSTQPSYIHKLNIHNTDFEFYETGMMKVYVKGGDNNITLIFDHDGNVTLENTSQLYVHSKNINIESDIQMDITCPTVTFNCKDNFNVVAPSITLDSGKGSTQIRTKSFGYKDKVKVTSF